MRPFFALIITAALSLSVLFLLLTFVFLQPCATEDSTNCLWDAQEAGNGQGNSFIDIGGKAYYLP